MSDLSDLVAAESSIKHKPPNNSNNTYKGNGPFSHIHFLHHPRRFPGEANDNLPPSSPPLSDKSSDEEDESPLINKTLLEDLACTRATAEKALLDLRTDQTIQFLVDHIDSWKQYGVSIKVDNQRYEQTNARLEVEIHHWEHHNSNMQHFALQYEEAVEELTTTRDTLKRCREEISQLTAQVGFLKEENGNLREDIRKAEELLEEYQQIRKDLVTWANQLEIESDDLKYILADFEDHLLGVPDGQRVVDRLFDPPVGPRAIPDLDPSCFEPGLGVKALQKHSGESSKQARYRESHCKELREKEHVRRANIYKADEHATEIRKTRAQSARK
ncbi:hypothetical protein PQX77_002516 [Marasmius sp. AFHP31]|nr:hypothetical protein PQX77_002516 [Marasmius sp. AFHP31]